MRRLWYHGGPRIEDWRELRWDRNRSESDLNAMGPGMYWTTDEEEAAGYGPHVYSATMLPDFTLVPRRKPTVKALLELYELSELENRVTFLSNWDLEEDADPRVALRHYANQDSLFDAYVTLYHDLFLYDAHAFVMAMRTLGYDGVKIERGTTGGSRRRAHLVVYNPRKLNVHGETGHEVSENPVAQDDEALAVYLNDRGGVPGIGPERGRSTQDGIAVFKSAHGSYRYVMYESGGAVSVLQVVSRDGKLASVANVYTLPERRRQGLARQLLERARRDFVRVDHSKVLSWDGRAWADAVGENPAAPEKELESHDGMFRLDGVKVERGTTGGSKRRTHLVVYNPRKLSVNGETGHEASETTSGWILSNQDISDRAVELFGTTEDPSLAAFIMADGRYLDRSSAHARNRSMPYDHYGIALYVLRDPTTAGGSLARFLKRTGAIRIATAKYQLALETKQDFTPEQRETLIRLFRHYPAAEVVIELSSADEEEMLDLDHTVGMLDVLTSERRFGDGKAILVRWDALNRGARENPVSPEKELESHDGMFRLVFSTPNQQWWILYGRDWQTAVILSKHQSYAAARSEWDRIHKGHYSVNE